MKYKKDLLDEIFGEKPPVWRNQYVVSWCDTCDGYSISCLEENCYGSSCNGSGCAKCSEITKDFNTAKTGPKEYLNAQERLIYDKIWYLHKYIKISLGMGDYQIDWQKLETDGQLCQYAYILFPEETKNLISYKGK